LSENAPVLVLGLGNILLKDEGVGVRVVEALEARGGCPAGVELLDGGTSGMDLIDRIGGREVVVIVDALATDEPPGTLIRLDGEQLDEGLHTRMSPHEVGLADVLGLLRLMEASPGRVVLYGIVPASLDLGLELTEAGARGRDAAVSAIEAELPMLAAIGAG
jgi:hydrogenase maturation protease